jgi:hypothetical protein
VTSFLKTKQLMTRGLAMEQGEAEVIDSSSEQSEEQIYGESK